MIDELERPSPEPEPEAHTPAQPPADEESEDFEALLNEYLPEATPKSSGELIDATVVGIIDDAVLVGYGGKEESAIPLEEFAPGKSEPSVRPGDTIRVLLEGFSKDGVAQLSYSRARAAEARGMIADANARRLPIRGTVSRVVRGGLLVDAGIEAFLPASQADLYRVADLNALVGTEIEAYVIEFDAAKGRAVLSRRELLEDRRAEGQKEFFEKVKPGDTVRGIVKDVLDFGVFVQIGNVEGLLPRSELSYDRGVQPSEVAAPGQPIEVRVVDMSPDTGKVTLSRKRLNRDPWETVAERYPVGSPATGRVVAVQPFGAFVQLEEGITGLVHVEDMSWDTGRKSAEDHFRIGDTLTCQVLEIDENRKRLALSLKHLMRDPWSDIETRYPVGSRHRGTVSSLRDFGAFVRLDENTEGLLHISDLSWKKRYKHPSEAVKEGEEVEVVVLKLDREQRRIGLGVKQLALSPFAQYRGDHPAGSIAKGKVSRIVPFGAFVELADGVEGLIHVSELDHQRVDSVERVLKLGEEVTVKIISYDEARNRIALSRRKALDALERENIRQYLSNEKDKEQQIGGGFGDLLNAALKKKKG